MSLLSRFLPPYRTRKEDAPQRRSMDANAGGLRGLSFPRNYGSHGPETLAAAPTIRARARRLYANNGFIRNAVNAIVAEKVGAGIEAISAHPDPAIAERITAGFAEAELFADGRTNLGGATAAAVLAEFVDGEAVFIAEGDQWRQLPCEFLDESDTRELGDGYSVAGVRFTLAGRRRAYNIRPQRPTDQYPTAAESILVPTDDVLHVFRPIGPDQVRGISQLAAAILPMNELDQNLDAMQVALKQSAMIAGFITNANGGTPAFADGEAGRLQDEGLTPGGLYTLGFGEDVKFLAADQSQEQIAFAKLIISQISAALGVPQHLLDGDLSQANYSSLRASLLPFRAKVEQFTYHTLVPQFLTPIFRRWVTTEYLAGRLDVPDLAPALKVQWLPPRPMQVDPQKDAEALVAMLDSGLISRRQAVASLGWNVAELDREIAADKAREAELGLSFKAAKGAAQ